MSDLIDDRVAPAATQPAAQHGGFIWYELLTRDPDAAAAFYGKVVGWTARDSGQEGMNYRLFDAGDGDVAGLMAIPPEAAEAGMRPGWLGYIGVAEVDVAVAQAQAAGATVHMPPTDIPDVGRFSLLADPQGVPFYMMQGASDETSQAFAPNLLGHCSWNELSTTDQEAAFAFYAGAFGWAKGDAMDMGEMGIYQFITLPAAATGEGCEGSGTIGAMMTRPQGAPAGWTFYFRVADVEQAAATAQAEGGTILHGPSEVPGGDHIIIGSDPQGATFALVGARQA